MQPINYSVLDAAHKHIARVWPEAKPSHALVCGSGWSNVVNAFELRDSMSYEDIPGMGKPGVIGHAGTLSWGSLHGLETFIFQGRRHVYEGEGWTSVATPIYLSKSCGGDTMVLTNSAGGIRAGMSVGQLMVIRDHINNMGIHPLIGAHNPIWGTRFADQSYIYRPELRALIMKAGKAMGLDLEDGVYLANTGPTYETPAEIVMFRGFGADAVGMSTVPEAMLANAAGLKVAGLSCITNLAAGISEQELTHEEVTQSTAEAMPRMSGLLEQFWKAMSEDAS